MNEIEQLMKSKFYQEIDETCRNAIENTRTNYSFDNAQWPPADSEISNLITFKSQEKNARKICSNYVLKDTSSDGMAGLVVLIVLNIVLFTANAVFTGLVIRQRCTR